MQNPSLTSTKIAIIGLGYVGLPLAVEFGKHFDTVGFDIDSGARRRIERRPRPHPRNAARRTGRRDAAALHHAIPAALADCNVFIVTVPTPVDEANRPDLAPLRTASASIGSALKRGDVVVYE